MANGPGPGTSSHPGGLEPPLQKDGSLAKQQQDVHHLKEQQGTLSDPAV